MKKALSIVLALVLVFALAVPAFAADGINGVDTDKYPLSWEGWKTGIFTPDAKYASRVLNPEGLDITVDEYVLWHFIDPGAEDGTATINFGDENGEVKLQVCKYAGASHFAVITPADWEIYSVSYTGNAVLRLSHVEPHNFSGGFSGETVVTFYKDITGAGTFPAELAGAFSFNIYKDGSSTPVNAAPLTNDEYGIINFTIAFAEGATKEESEANRASVLGGYTIKEIQQTGWKQVTYLDGLKFSVDLVDDIDGTQKIAVNWGDIAEFANAFENTELGSLDLDLSDGIKELHTDAYHKLVYQEYNYNTLVAFGNKMAKPLPDGVTGTFLNNGMPYLTINYAKLVAAGNDGIKIEIAESNKSGGAQSAAWNTPIGKYFTVKLVNGKVVVISDLPGFTALVSNKAFTGNPVSNCKHLDDVVGTITKDKDINLFFHIGSAHWVDYNDLLGCEFDKYGDVTETAISYDDVEIGVIGYNADGEVAFEGDYLGVYDDLDAGEYTVELYINGTKYATSTAIVVAAGSTAAYDFGEIVLNPNAPIVDSINCDCTKCEDPCDCDGCL